ncbi:MAG: DUF5615 family PIN-like protein [Ignavibacteria bacterium]
MNLLFDNNLSYKLPKLLADFFPDSIHVTYIGMQYSEDIDIWNYAKENKFTIVTKDKDFYFLNSALGSPPQLIWLALGNCKIEVTINVLIKNQKDKFHFIDSDKDILILKNNSK